MRRHGVAGMFGMLAAAALGMSASGCHHAQGGEVLAPYQPQAQPAVAQAYQRQGQDAARKLGQTLAGFAQPNAGDQ